MIYAALWRALPGPWPVKVLLALVLSFLVTLVARRGTVRRQEQGT